MTILHLEEDAHDAGLIEARIREAVPEVQLERVAGFRPFADALKSSRYDLILCDYGVPGLDGDKAYELVRQHDEIVPVILVSGTLEGEMAVSTLKKGVSDIILKGRLDRLPGAIHKARIERLERIALREAERMRRMQTTILEAAANGVAITDTQGNLLWANQAFQETSGYALSELVGQNMRILKSGVQDELQYAELWRTISSGKPYKAELVNRRKNGEFYRVDQTITPILDNDGNIEFYAAIGADITKMTRLEERLAHSILYDSRTDLPNRSNFINQIDVALQHLRRRPQYHFAVLLLDVSRFKLLNASYGEAVGDEIISQVAALLKKSARPGDVVARLGTDVFGFLADDLGSPDDIALVHQNVMRSLSAPFQLGAYTIHVEFYCGIAAGHEQCAAGHELLNQADAALQQAKVMGGPNRWLISNPGLNERARKRMWTETVLRSALEEKRVITLFQPILDVESEKLKAFECLVRIQHPEQGFVSPLEFIPIAEETGLIGRLTSEVISAACEAQQHFPADVRFNINVSGTQLAEADLADRLKELIADSGGNAAGFMLELTESSFISAANLGAIDGLINTGFQLAIDDFGTGYSSLSYLTRLKVDCVKIDRTFVKDCPDNKSSAAIAQAIVALAQGLGMSTTAEGAETAEHVAYLRSIGCDSVQGFYYSKPLPLEEAISWARGHQAG